jgi:ATP-dependent helicase/DNAse subunit B
MTARVAVLSGPEGSGKTTTVLTRYREALARKIPGSTLWLAPTWRSAQAVRGRLLDGSMRGCISPAVMTFDQFAEAVLQSSPEPIRPLTSLQKRLLVRRVIDEALAADALQYFRPVAETSGFLDLVCDFLRELKQREIWPDHLRQACQTRGMTRKDRDLLEIYEAYQRCLLDRHLYDTEGRFWSARQVLQAGQWRPADRLRLVVADGFADFTPPQHEIFEILAQKAEEILFTLSVEPASTRTDLFAKPELTLAELRRRHPGLVERSVSRPARPRWPALAHLEAHLFADPQSHRPAEDTSGLEILATSGTFTEIELVGARIKRLLTQGNPQSDGRPVPPGDVAVVLRSPADAADLVREVFCRLGLPVVIESGQALDSSPALAALVSLVRLDVEDWPFRQLLSVLLGNYFRPDWPEWEEGRVRLAVERAVRGLQVPGGRDRLIQELERTCRLSEPAEESQDQRSLRAKAALPPILRLRETLDRLPRQATLGGWALAWRDMAAQTGLLRVIDERVTIGQPITDAFSVPSPCPRPNGARVHRTVIDRPILTCLGTRTGISDRVAWDRLQEALSESDAVARWADKQPRQVNRREALAALIDVLHSVKVFDQGDDSGCVRVLAAESVRALEIPFLFFIGLAEQSFPRAQRADRLYDEGDRGRLIDAGLKLAAPDERNQDEMLLFYEVITRATRQLIFSYPALDEKAQPLSPSPYLEEVEQTCGPGRIHRTEAAELSPVPTCEDPLTTAEFRVKAAANALEGNVSLLSGLVREETTSAVAENVLAGLGVIHQRQDQERFRRTEGILDGKEARRQLASQHGPESVISATDLERYAACPFRFLMERVLKLEVPEELALEADYLGRGLLVHEALARFHYELNRSQGCPTSPSTLEEAEYGRLMSETLDAIRHGSQEGLLEAALGEVNRRVWGKWAEDYLRQHRDYDSLWSRWDTPSVPTLFEVSFGGSRAAEAPSTTEPFAVETPEGTVLVSGRIDRIDIGSVAGTTTFNVIDYKTGSSSKFSLEGVAAGTALQLPLYAIAAEELLLADRQGLGWQAGYWLVSGKGFHPKKALVMHTSVGDNVETAPDWPEVRRTLTTTVGVLVGALRRGEFPVFNADDECTRNCPLRTICRINHIRSLEKTWQPTSAKA